MPSIHSLGLGKVLVRRLEDAGIKTLEELASWNRRELGSIPGVGPKSIVRIEEVIHPGFRAGSKDWSKYGIYGFKRGAGADVSALFG